MSSLFNVLGIARDALMVQQAGIDVTGQNIANATTPGYVRRDAVVETRGITAANGGAVFTGTSRQLDTFAFGRLVDEEGRKGEANARADALATIESLIGPAASNLGTRIDDLFSSFQTLAATPSDISARRAVLSKAQSLVEAFGALSGGLSNAQAELAKQAAARAEAVNASLAEMASLNGRISQAQALGQDANDLRDRRDVLVRQLGQTVGARAIEDDKGEVTVFAAGIALVTGTQASSLDVSVSSTGSLAVRATRPGGSVVDVTAGVTEGELGGLVRAREQDAPAAISAVDDLAFEIANAVNAVHASGFGLDAVSGRNLFEVPASATGAAYALRVSADVAGQPERLAAAASGADVPGGSDTAIALAALATGSLPSGASPSDGWAKITSDLGTRLASAKSESALRTDTVSQAETLHASASGVSLDEENVKLTQYQRAFEASTRVLQTVDQLLDGLMKSL